MSIFLLLSRLLYCHWSLLCPSQPPVLLSLLPPPKTKDLPGLQMADEGVQQGSAPQPGLALVLW